MLVSFDSLEVRERGFMNMLKRGLKFAIGFYLICLLLQPINLICGYLNTLFPGPTLVYGIMLVTFYKIGQAALDNYRKRQLRTNGLRTLQ